MRWFTAVVSVLFVGIGLMMIRDGDRTGWWMAGFFGCCFLVALFEPWLPKPWLETEYHVVMTPEEIACRHARRTGESIRWADIRKVWFVTTSSGPHLPDAWIVLEGTEGGCSMPTEAKGFDAFLDGLEKRFPGFDFGPMIEGGTTDARHLCWERGDRKGGGDGRESA